MTDLEAMGNEMQDCMSREIKEEGDRTHKQKRQKKRKQCHEKFSQNMSNTVQTSGCSFQKNSVLKRLSAISRSAFAEFYRGYVTKVGLNFINLNGKEGSLRLVLLTSMTAALLRSYKTLGSDL